MSEAQLLTTREAAGILNVSESFLEKDRCLTARIPFVRVGLRAVRYERGVLDRYIQSQRRASTADSGSGRPSRDAKALAAEALHA